MILEIGRFCLILALSVALVQVVILSVGVWKKQINMMQVAGPGALLQFLLVGISLLSLTTMADMHLTSSTPLFLALRSLWLSVNDFNLFWTFSLALWLFLFSVFSKRLPMDLRAVTLAVLSSLIVGFYCFSLSKYGLQGSPLVNPILYLAYAGFSVIFSFSVATLIKGRLNAVWLRPMRLWATISWCLLTIGVGWQIAAGYSEIWRSELNAKGLGGILPWLISTALLHALLVVEKRGAIKVWATLLGLSVYSFSLIVVFFTHSGALGSTNIYYLKAGHEKYLLIWVLFIIVGSLLLHAVRAKKFISNTNFSFFSREMMLIISTGLIALLVLLTFLAVFEAGSIAATFINASITAVILMLAFLQGIGPYFKWQHNAIRAISFRILMVAAISVLFSVITLRLLGLTVKPLAVAGLGASFWILLQTLNHWLSWERKAGFMWHRMSRSQWAMVLAHTGGAVILMGASFASQYGGLKHDFFVYWFFSGVLMVTLAGICVGLDRRYRVKSKEVSV